MERPAVSIFYPCYNDWATMASMVLMTMRTAERMGIDYDITIVNDGSGEHTNELLEVLKEHIPSVNIVHHEKNKGYGHALRTGFASATKPWLFYTDGDAQYDVRELALLVDKAGPDVDVVQGYKIARNDPWHRIVIGRVYHWIIRTTFGLKLRDVDCDFRLMRSDIFKNIELNSPSGTICAEMMTKIQRAGYRITEVPVHHHQRAHGKSQFFNFRRLARVALQLIGLWYREVFLYHLKRRKT